jgi:hypothetical protein
LGSLELLTLSQDQVNYDPATTSNFPFTYLSWAINSGDTLYVHICDDGVSYDPGPADRTLHWRFLTTQVWQGPSTFPDPVYSGSNQLGRAMNSFGGSTWPTNPDANGYVWTDAVSWTPDGTVTLTLDGLLMDSNNGDVAIDYQDSGGGEPWLTCATDLEYQIGFIITGFPGDTIHTHSPYDVWSVVEWRTSGGKWVGIMIQTYWDYTSPSMTVECGDYGNNYFQVPTNWPIRTKWKYSASAQRWTAYLSFDGGATWRFGGIGDYTTPTTETYRSPESGFFPGYPTSTYLFEGWSSEAPLERPNPATEPGLHAVYHNGAWHIIPSIVLP